MNKVVQSLNTLKLVRNPKIGTSLEILENMNKLNLIHNADISANYATELILSMCLKTDSDVNAFAKQFGAKGNFTLATFFEEFEKVRMFKDKENREVSNIKFKSEYYDVINEILKDSEGLKDVAIKSKGLKMPTINDYLRVALKENTQAKANNANLDAEIDNEEDITGNEHLGYSKYIKDNYKKQILSVTKGFNVKMVMVTSKNLTDKQIKLMSKFKNVKTSATARITNKLGGKGYLCSPTKERKVTYYCLDKRFIGSIKTENPKKLSFNDMLLYSLTDLNARALKYKKGYIANAIAKSSGFKASKEDIKLVTDLTKTLATRYMLFGLDLNNGTNFDPNIAYDYRLELLFINKLKNIQNKEEKAWLLPVVQELASNMASEFFKNAEITPEVIKGNLANASKMLPEFSREFKDNKTYTGVLFNSEVSTYNQGKNNVKVRRPRKETWKNKISNLFKAKSNSDEKVTNSTEQEENNKTVRRTGNTIEFMLFGQKNEFKVFSFEEYCANYVENILIPCSNEDGLTKAKEIYAKYSSITDDTLSVQDKLTQAMGEDLLNKFYNRYVDYAEKEAVKRCAYCEGFVDVVKDKLDNAIVDRLNRESTDVNGVVNVNNDNIAKLEALRQRVEEDASLSNISELEELIGVVVDATKEKATSKARVEDSVMLDKHCKNKTNKTIDEYLEEFIEKTLNPQIKKSTATGLMEKLVPSHKVVNPTKNTNNESTETNNTNQTEINNPNVNTGNYGSYLDVYNNIWKDNICRLCDKFSEQEMEMYDEIKNEEFLNKSKEYIEIKKVFMDNDWESNIYLKDLKEEKENLWDNVCQTLGSVSAIENMVKDNFDNNEIQYKMYLQNILYHNLKEKGLLVEDEPEVVEEAVETTILEDRFTMFTGEILNADVKRVNLNCIYDTIYVREFDETAKEVYTVSKYKTPEMNDDFNKLQEFYNGIINVYNQENLNSLNMKRVNNDLTLEEETVLNILTLKNKYIEEFKVEDFSSSQEFNIQLDMNKYFNANKQMYEYEVAKLLESADNQYLHGFQMEEPEIVENLNSDKANKVKAVKALLRREVKDILVEKVESINVQFADKNLARFYDYYKKAFGSIRRLYDAKSTNAPYKGISQEACSGIKKNIDKYLVKEILNSIKNDPEFDTLSSEELVAKYVDKVALKNFVLSNIENNIVTLIGNNYDLNLDKRIKDFKTGANVQVGLNKPKSTGLRYVEPHEEPEIVESTALREVEQ
ncbi:MAG: hypothetical protein IJZ29_00770 [Clostridia bacterium]|nr:hypothetical protein [Clostridia bacterium]